MPLLSLEAWRFWRTDKREKENLYSSRILSLAFFKPCLALYYTSLSLLAFLSHGDIFSGNFHGTTITMAQCGPPTTLQPSIWLTLMMSLSAKIASTNNPNHEKWKQFFLKFLFVCLSTVHFCGVMRSTWLAIRCPFLLILRPIRRLFISPSPSFCHNMHFVHLGPWGTETIDQFKG